MRILRVERVEDCFDRSLSATLVADGPWTRDAILRVGSLGRLDYFEDFPRPFYRVRAAAGWQLKGVEGECTCQLVGAVDLEATRTAIDGRLV